MSKLELQDITKGMVPIETCKKWYTSRTVWLNVATVVAGAAPLIGNFVGLVSPLTYAVLMTAVGVGNIALRFMTDQGVN